jgi:hypothetical protein
MEDKFRELIATMAELGSEVHTISAHAQNIWKRYQVLNVPPVIKALLAQEGLEYHRSNLRRAEARLGNYVARTLVKDDGPEAAESYRAMTLILANEIASYSKAYEKETERLERDVLTAFEVAGIDPKHLKPLRELNEFEDLVAEFPVLHADLIAGAEIEFESQARELKDPVKVPTEEKKDDVGENFSG